MGVPQEKTLPQFPALNAVQLSDLFCGYHLDLGHWTGQQVLDFIGSHIELGYGVQTVTSAGSANLLNPMSNLILVTMTAPSGKLMLAPMNAGTSSYDKGRPLVIMNIGSYEFGVCKSGIFPSSWTVPVNSFIRLYCTDDSTEAGEWQVENIAISSVTDLQSALDAKKDVATMPIISSVLTVIALKGVNISSMPDGALAMVRNIGLFRYSTSASNTADDVIYVAPNSGSGRWIRVTNNLAVASATTISSGTSATVAATDFGKEITVAVTGSAFTYNLPDSTTLSLTPGFYFDVVQAGTGTVTFAGMTNTTTSVVHGNTILPGVNDVNVIRKVRVKLYATNVWLIENNSNLLAYNTITGSTTISTAHVFLSNQCNSASAIALTIPTDASGTIITGSWMRFIQKNTGQVSFPISSGISVYNEVLGDLTSSSGITPKLVNAKGATAWLEKVSPTEYLLKGDITS